MRARRIAIAAFVVLAAALAGAEVPSPEAISGSLRAIDPATDDPVLLDWASGPTHIAFIATWCRPCLEEVPSLYDVEDRWKADGYRLLLVALPTRQSVDRLRELLDQGPLPGRLLFDAAGGISKAFGVTTIPAHALIDRQGRLVARAGALDEAFAQAVERSVRQEGRSRR